MRHLRSILYALVLAPAAWILCGVGFDQDLTGRARDNGGPESVGGLLLLLLAGAAYAILLFAPISPAGPLLAGLVFLGVGIWARVAPDAYAGVWPADVTKDGFNVSTPGYGLALLLAVPLLSTALSARRWAGYEPPQVVFIGTLGRARGAATAPGTTLAAEPTTAFNAGAGEEDDKTTLLSALFPAADRQSPVDAPAEGSDEPTHDVARSEEPTRDVAKSEEVTTVISAPVGDPGEKTQVIRPVPAASPSAAGPSAASSSAASRTSASSTAASSASGSASGSTAGSAAGSASGSVPGEATTKAMSISGAERPDPGQDPTTRLTPVPPASPPGEATTRASKTSTVAHLERPADEAADDTRPLTLPAPRPDDEGSDDTRPLTLPAPRPPADDEVTRRL